MPASGNSMWAASNLYLLDTDFDANIEEDRSITHNLYGGNNENRLKQELLLGIGGIRALELLCIKPDLYHSNEGHSAFIGLERMRNYMQQATSPFTRPKKLCAVPHFLLPIPLFLQVMMNLKRNCCGNISGIIPNDLRINWNELMATWPFQHQCLG